MAERVEISEPICIICDDPAAEGSETCSACAREMSAEEERGSICDACGNRGCTSPACAKEIRSEMRADADRDDPGAREERLLERGRSWRNE